MRPRPRPSFFFFLNPPPPLHALSLPLSLSLSSPIGIATAFASPIGGLLLAVEEGASFLGQAAIWRAFLATSTGVTVLQLLTTARGRGHNGHGSGGGAAAAPAGPPRLGIWRDLGLYSDPVAGYGRRYWFTAADLPAFALLGAGAGGAGAALIALNARLTALRLRYVPAANRARRGLEVLAIAWLTCTAFFLALWAAPCAPLPPAPYLAAAEPGWGSGGGGHAAPAPHHGGAPPTSSSKPHTIYGGGGGEAGHGLAHFPRLWCGAGEFNTRGQLFFGPLSTALRVTIHLGGLDPPPGVTPTAFAAAVAPTPATLITWALALWPLTALTFGIGAATGVFVPSLAMGAAAGRLAGLAYQGVLRALGSASTVSLASYAVVGAAASLGGVTRMTFSIVVLVAEGAGALQLVVPLALAVTAARVAGDAWGPSIYDVHVRIRGTPVLGEPGVDARQRMAADKLSVGELAATQVTALPPVLRVGDAVTALRSSGHGAFPISPNTGGAAREGGAFELHGVLARATLVRLLEGRVGLFAWEAWEGGGGAPPPPSSSSPSSSSPPPPSCPPLSPAADRVPATQAARLDLLARLQQRPLKVRRGEPEASILDGLTPAERELWLDVRPFMRRCPFVLQVRGGGCGGRGRGRKRERERDVRDGPPSPPLSPPLSSTPPTVQRLPGPRAPPHADDGLAYRVCGPRPPAGVRPADPQGRVRGERGGVPGRQSGGRAAGGAGRWEGGGMRPGGRRRRSRGRGRAQRERGPGQR